MDGGELIAVNGLKQCSSCKTVYSVELKMFAKNKVTKDGLQNVCLKCKAKMTRNWKYGLKNGIINKMILEQKGEYLICLKDINGDGCLDYCHTSKKIRGILCRKCNGMLGMVNDNISSLKRAIQYLKKNGTEE